MILKIKVPFDCKYPGCNKSSHFLIEKDVKEIKYSISCCFDHQGWAIEFLEEYLKKLKGKM